MPIYIVTKGNLDNKKQRDDIMGLAASQCRYLMLIAKKADNEFQGQQINQARTVLTNESSGLYSQLTDMEVPTAPSSSNYTKTTYTFKNADNTNACTILSSKSNTSTSPHSYDITYSWDTTDTVTKSGNAIYSVDSSNKYYKGSDTTTTPLISVADAISGASLTAAQIAGLKSALSQTYKADYDGSKFVKTGTSTAQTYGTPPTTPQEYYYTTNADGAYQIVDKEELATIASNSSGNLTYMYLQEGAAVQKTDTMTKCNVVWSDSGRMNSFTYTDPVSKETTTYTLSCTTTTDETAYNDAYNEYEYNQQVYNNKQQSINAKLDIVQSQDKKLELQLQHLDSTESELSTEMDSVSGVIKKNIEKSFKVFA